MTWHLPTYLPTARRLTSQYDRVPGTYTRHNAHAFTSRPAAASCSAVTRALNSFSCRMKQRKKDRCVVLASFVLILSLVVCEGAWKGRQGQLPRTKIPTPSSNRKLGPPSRRSIQPPIPTTEDEPEALKTGRVSVHCVGSSINLPELRAHVFRRGFGTGGPELMVDDIIDRMSLKLDRIDSEEYLHISNEPMFVSTQGDSATGSSGRSDVKVQLTSPCFTFIHFIYRIYHPHRFTVVPHFYLILYIHFSSCLGLFLLALCYGNKLLVPRTSRK